MMKEFRDENGKWIIENGVKYLVEESEERKKRRKKEQKKAEKAEKERKVKELGKEIIKELPELIAAFYPVIKTMLRASGIELTKKQKDLLKKYIELKKIAK